MDVDMEFLYSFFVILITHHCVVLGFTSIADTNTMHTTGQATVSGQTDHFNTFTEHEPNAHTMSTDTNFSGDAQFPEETYKQMDPKELASWLFGIQSTFTNNARIVPITSPFTQKPTTLAGIEHDSTMTVGTESYLVNDAALVNRTSSLLSKVLSTRSIMDSGDRTTTGGYSEYLAKSMGRWSSTSSVQSTELTKGAHGTTVVSTTVLPTPTTITALGGLSEYPTYPWSVTPVFPTVGSMEDLHETKTTTAPSTTSRTVTSTTSPFTSTSSSSSSSSSTVYDRVVYTDSTILNYGRTDLERLSTTGAATITPPLTATVSDVTTTTNVQEKTTIKLPETTTKTQVQETTTTEVPETTITTSTTDVPETTKIPKVQETAATTKKVPETTTAKVSETTTTSSDMADPQDNSASETRGKMIGSPINTTGKLVSTISKSKQFESLHRKRFMEVLKIVNGTDRFNMSLLEALDPDLIPPEVLARFINSLKPENVTQLDEDALKIEHFDIVQKVISMDKLVVAGCTVSVATFLFIVLLCIVRCRNIKPEPQNESMKSDILHLSKKSNSSLSRNGSVNSDTFMGIPTNNAIWRDIQSLPETSSSVMPESKSSEISKF